MVDSFGEMGESFVCHGREMVFPRGVSSLGIFVSLICLSMWSPPVCWASSLSEFSSSPGSLSELVSCPFGIGFVLVSSMSKMWILLSGCRSRGSPELESCVI